MSVVERFFFFFGVKSSVKCRKRFLMNLIVIGSCYVIGFMQGEPDCCIMSWYSSAGRRRRRKTVVRKLIIQKQAF